MAPTYSQIARRCGKVLPCSWTVGSGWGGTRSVPPPTLATSPPAFHFSVTPPDTLPCSVQVVRVDMRTRKALMRLLAPRTWQTLRVVDPLAAERYVWSKALGTFYHVPDVVAPAPVRRSEVRSRKPEIRALRAKLRMRELERAWQRSVDYGGIPYVEWTRAKRSIMLLTKLRAALERFAVKRRPCNRLAKLGRREMRNPIRRNAEALKASAATFLKQLLRLGQLMADAAPSTIYSENGQVNVNVTSPNLTGDTKSVKIDTVNVNFKDLTHTSIASVLDMACDKIFGKAKIKVADWGDKSISVILSLLGAIPSQSKFTWFTAALSICHVLGFYNANTLSNLLACLSGGSASAGELINMVLPGESNIQPGEDGQMAPPASKIEEMEQNQMWSRFATILHQGIGTVLNVSTAKEKPDAALVDKCKTVFEAVRTEARSTGGFLSFFKNIIEVVRDCISAVLQWWKPELRDIANAATNDVMKQQWLDELAWLRHNINTGTQWNQHIMDRVEAAILMAEEFMKLSVSTPNLMPANFSQLLGRNYTWLQEKRNEGHKKGFSAVTRYTPYCLYLFGKVGIGKSECVTDLLPIFSTAMQIPPQPDLLFVKPAVAEFFTNCNHQPCMLYDDFCQVAHTNPAASDGATLIYIKSSAPFNPPMASVEDKPLLYSPKVIIASSNQGWPKPVYLSTYLALWRRRDLLVEVILRDGYDMAQVKKKYLDTDVRTFEHLIFRVYTDPLVERGDSYDLDWNGFCKAVTKSATEYHACESGLLAKRVALVTHRMDEIDTLEDRCADKVKDIIEDQYREWEKEFLESGSVKISKYWNIAKSYFVNQQRSIDPTTEAIMAVASAETAANVKAAAEDVMAKVKAQKAANLAELVKIAEDANPKPSCSNVESGNVQMAPPLVGVVNGTVEQAAEIVVEQATEAVPATNTALDDTVISCTHRDPAIFRCGFDFVSGKLINKTNRKQTFSTLMCVNSEGQPDCVFQNKLVQGAFKRSLASSHYKSMLYHKSLSASTSGKTHIMDVVQETTFWDKAHAVWVLIKKALTPAMKLVFALLKVLAVIVAVIGLCYGLLYGMTVGITSIGKYFTQSEDEPTSFSSIVKDASYKEMQNWASLQDDQARIRDAIVASAQRSAQTTPSPAVVAMQAGQTYNIDPKTTKGAKPVVSIAKANSQIAKSVNDMFNALKRNTFFLTVTGVNKHTKNPVQSVARGFGVGGSWAIIPKHYIHAWEAIEIHTIYYENGADSKIINSNAIQRVFFDNRELCAIKLPNISNFKSIQKHFYTIHDWTGPLQRAASVIEIMKDKTIVMHNEQFELMSEFNIMANDIVLSTIGPVMKYKVQKTGLCMAVVLAANGKILGFHIAGGKSGGYAEPLVAETLTQLEGVSISGASLKHLLAPVNEDGQMPAPKLAINTNVRTIGVVKPEFVRYEKGISSVVPSAIHEVFPITHLPPYLKPCKENGYTNPLAEGVRKHGMPCFGFDCTLLNSAAERLKLMLITKAKPYFQTVGVWDEVRACNGVSGVPNLSAIVLQTSEGFPYTSMRPTLPPGTPKKQWLLNRVDASDGQHSYKFHKLLRTILDEKTQMREQGISPRSVFIDCLKDQKLAVDKVCVPGKVRIFSISPLDYIIQYRQYFGDFMAAYVSSRLQVHHAIGIAPEKIDWTELAFKLQSKGTKILCGDYKNFGPAFAKDVHERVNTVLRDWYAHHGADDKSTQYRRILQLEVENAVHLAQDHLYEVPCGMPSGSPETAIKNSLVNTLYIYYMWMYIWLPIDIKMATYDMMVKHLWFVTYGDDIIANVSDEAAEHFNNLTLQYAFAKHGVTYTDDSKSGEVRKWCTLSEATFLKRRFVPHPFRPNVIMSQIHFDVATDVANWIQKVSQDQYITQSVEASYQCLALAYGLGAQHHEDLRQILLNEWRKHDVEFTPRTWFELDDINFGPLHSGMVSWLETPYKDGVVKTNVIGEAGQMSELMSTEIAANVSEQTEDTILQTHDTPVVVTDPGLGVRTALLSTSDNIVKIPKLSDRQIVLDVTPWDSTKSFGELLKQWNLPHDALGTTAQSPNWHVLWSFAYYRPSDITLHFSLNSSKFSAGQVQISAYYDYHLDPNAADRDNPYSRSQMLHCILDAGSSNSAKLVIPYRHFNPWLKLASKDDKGKFVNVKMMVLNSYSTPDTCASRCNIITTWEMNGLEMTGMRPVIDLVGEGQMFPMAALMAMQYLNQKYADTNRDKPPVQLNAMPLEPRATGSLAAGTNTVEHLNALRLDARGQVPHPDGTDFVDSFPYYAQRYGLLTQIEWQASQGAGTKLWQIPVGPLSDVKFYPSVTAQKSPEITAYYVPPVGVIASCFDQFSGGMKYRFDVVGTQMHTGSLMAVFIPGYAGTATIPFDKARYSYNVIFDVHEQRTFEFETPYVADKPWWSVLNINGDDDSRIDSFGTVFLFVVNPLIPMCSVSSNVSINIYVAAAENMRFSIPVQPQLSLSWYLQARTPPSDGSITARAGYYPFYGGTWRWFKDGQGCILRWGTLSDRIAQFNNPEQGNEQTGEWFYYVYTGNLRFTWSELAYTQKAVAFVPVDVNDGWGHVYLAATPIVNLVHVFKSKYTASNKTPDWTVFAALDDSSAWLSDDNLPFRRVAYEVKLSSAAESDFSDLGEGQMPDPRVNTTIVEQPSSETAPDRNVLTFGESFDSIKSLLRRYEYLNTISITVNAKTPVNQTHLIFFALPQGHAIELDNQTQAFMRDGLQTLVLSGFRYFRGSLNYKLALLNTKGTIWVQHRPEQVVDYTNFRQGTLESHCYQHGYASTLGVMAVNPIVTINVPYYNPNAFVLLQQPHLNKSAQIKRAMSLGMVQAGVNMPVMDNSRAQLHVYKSLGDDACPSTFVGFPRVVPTFIFEQNSKDVSTGVKRNSQL